MPSDEDRGNSKEFLDYLDNVLHKIINNQQAVLGQAELMEQRNDLSSDLRDDIKLILKMIAENNELVVHLRRKLRQQTGA
jgi:hypothetical protein